MEALNLTRGPSMHWEVVGVKQYNTTLVTLGCLHPVRRATELRPNELSDVAECAIYFYD